MADKATAANITLAKNKPNLEDGNKDEGIGLTDAFSSIFTDTREIYIITGFDTSTDQGQGQLTSIKTLEYPDVISRMLLSQDSNSSTLSRTATNSPAGETGPAISIPQPLARYRSPEAALARP